MFRFLALNLIFCSFLLLACSREGDNASKNVNGAATDCPNVGKPLSGSGANCKLAAPPVLEFESDFGEQYKIFSVEVVFLAANQTCIDAGMVLVGESIIRDEQVHIHNAMKKLAEHDPQVIERAIWVGNFELEPRTTSAKNFEDVKPVSSQTKAMTVCEL